MSDAVPLAPRQIARHTGDRGRGSPLIPLRSTPETPFLDQHHKMWVGPDETGAAGLAGSEGHSELAEGQTGEQLAGLIQIQDPSETEGQDKLQNDRKSDERVWSVGPAWVTSRQFAVYKRGSR